MSQESAQGRIDYLLALTAERDAELARALGISQPTVWRLRHRKLKRPDRYRDLLESYLAHRAPMELDQVLGELRLMAGGNPHLVDFIRSLVQTIQSYSARPVDGRG